MSETVASTNADTQAEGWSLRAWGMMIGVALALLPMLVRLQSPVDLLPYWDGDPLSQESVVIGLTPATSLVGDLVSVMGAALLLACGPRRGLKSLVKLALVGVGAWACLWHLPGRGFDAKAAVTGGAWLSAAVVAFALWFAGKDRRVRLVAFALIAGAVGLLAMKGLYQVVIEHPAMVDAFQRDKAAILQRNGWQEGSAMAKSYERRLMQSEATGWFGFANVYASFAAMGFAVFSLTLIGLLRKRKDDLQNDDDDARSSGVVVIVIAGVVLSGGALVMAGAKGGYAAAALGVGVGLVLMGLRSERGQRLRGWSWLIGPAVIAAPLAAVVARGAVGERIGELSLLFRWFYMQGAARIFGGHWQHGVGPDGFQTAYALAKNPLSPEDVTSPHSVMWDWAACLGVGGIAWAAWLICMSTRLGPAAVRSDDRGGSPAESGETRVMMRIVCAIAALGAMIAIPMQYAALLPEEAFGVRIGGLVVCCVLSCGVLAAARVWQGWPVALGAGAAVLLAHTQIEISGIWMQSCGLVLAMIALAASGCSREKIVGGAEPATADTVRRSWLPGTVGVLGCVAAAFMLLGPLYMMILGDYFLLRSYALLQPVREGRAQLALAIKDRSPDARSIAQELAKIEPDLIKDALRLLPREWPTSRSASQLAMQLAQAYAGDPSKPDSRARATAWTVRAVGLVVLDHDRELDDLLDKPVVAEQEAAGALVRLRSAPIAGIDSRAAAWAATICSAAADGSVPPSAQEWRELSVKYLLSARASDPYNPLHAMRLMDTYERLGRPEDARRAAKDLLDVDTLQRLDRTVRGLNDRDRARAERLAAGGSGPDGGGVSPGSR